MMWYIVIMQEIKDHVEDKRLHEKKGSTMVKFYFDYFIINIILVVN